MAVDLYHSESGSRVSSHRLHHHNYLPSSDLRSKSPDFSRTDGPRHGGCHTRSTAEIHNTQIGISSRVYHKHHYRNGSNDISRFKRGRVEESHGSCEVSSQRSCHVSESRHKRLESSHRSSHDRRSKREKSSDSSKAEPIHSAFPHHTSDNVQTDGNYGWPNGKRLNSEDSYVSFGSDDSPWQKSAEISTASGMAIHAKRVLDKKQRGSEEKVLGKVPSHHKEAMSRQGLTVALSSQILGSSCRKQDEVVAYEKPSNISKKEELEGEFSTALKEQGGGFQDVEYRETFSLIAPRTRWQLDCSPRDAECLSPGSGSYISCGSQVTISNRDKLDKTQESNEGSPNTVQGDEGDIMCGLDEHEEDPSLRSKSPDKSDMSQACRSVFDFKRLNKISEGTYGVVFKAQDKRTGEIVALKKVKMGKEKEGFPITALREINLLLSMDHPAIVTVKEVVTKDLDDVFMVMEYIEKDMTGLLKTYKQPFSQSEVKSFMLQILQGVEYLHSNWVLHRDLKPSNLLVDSQGRVKICDFGLARQYGSPLGSFTSMVVTLWYRAPELLLGSSKYSTAIDMWSVGCIMAELLGKVPLFDGERELDQLKKIVQILGKPDEVLLRDKLSGVQFDLFKKPLKNRLREKFPATSFTGKTPLSESGFDLLSRLLAYDPERRISAVDAVRHPWFEEDPLPKPVSSPFC